MTYGYVSDFSPEKAWVYFIYNGSDAVKIGVTENLDARLSTLQTGNAHKLKYLDAFWCKNRQEAMIVERYAHEMFAPYRMSGEWFEAAPVLEWWGTKCQEKSVFIGPYEWRDVE